MVSEIIGIIGVLLGYTVGYILGTIDRKRQIMTREEREKAVEFFKFHRKIFCEDYLKKIPKESIAYQATLKEKEFYDMAIKALEQKPCTSCIEFKRYAKEMGFEIEQESCEDCVNVISIPEGATNGDMIKAMFPNARVSEIYPSFNGDEVYYVPIEKVNGVTNEMRVMKSWWNAPYRKVEE